MGSAAVLAVCSYASLQSYHRGQLCRPATLVSLGEAQQQTDMANCCLHASHALCCCRRLPAVHAICCTGKPGAAMPTNSQP